MENKYKIGDIVRCLSDDSNKIKIGTILTIKDITRSYRPGVGTGTFIHFEESKEDSYGLYEDEIELISQINQNTKSKESKGYWEILEECTEIAIQRQTQYAPIDENYKNLCEAYNILTGKTTTKLEFNEYMIALKLGRIKSNPNHKDNYIDLINYLAIQLYLMETKNENK